MEYAYARVSAKDQNLERQTEKFLQFGIRKKNIFCDKKSGKDFERSAYLKLVKKLSHGDLVVIQSIDRLGRNYEAIIAEWDRITNKIGADILVLDMPLLDTRTKADTLVGKFISDIVLQILSFVAENERQNIRSRQAEGIALAKARGVRFGRPPFSYSERFISTVDAYRRKTMNLREALSALNMTSGNFYYHLHRYEETVRHSEIFL